MSSIDAGTSGSVGNVGPADDRPLTEQEYQLLQRLLSDPFSLPIQFKSWLVGYLETSDMNLPISAVNGLSSILGIAGVGGGTLGIFPAGLILPFGGDAAPSGSLACDGALYDIISQQRLYDAIGLKYSLGRPAPPTGEFYVPDYRDRTLFGVGTGALTNQIGKTDGLASGARGGPAHHHHFNKNIGVAGTTDGVGDHTHGFREHTEATIAVQQGTAGTVINVGSAGGFDTNTGAAGGHSHNVSANGTVDGDTTGGGAQDTSSYGTCNFIIVA